MVKLTSEGDLVPNIAKEQRLDTKLAKYEIAEVIASGHWRNIDARAILRDTYGIQMVGIYNSTVPMHECHRINKVGKECSHYCHPSAPQLWVYQLWKTLQEHVPLVTKAGVKRDSFSCVRIDDYEENAIGQGIKKQHQRHYKLAASGRRIL